MASLCRRGRGVGASICRGGRRVVAFLRRRCRPWLPQVVEITGSWLLSVVLVVRGLPLSCPMTSLRRGGRRVVAFLWLRVVASFSCGGRRVVASFCRGGRYPSSLLVVVEVVVSIRLKNPGVLFCRCFVDVFVPLFRSLFLLLVSLCLLIHFECLCCMCVFFYFLILCLFFIY